MQASFSVLPNYISKNRCCFDHVIVVDCKVRHHTFEFCFIREVTSAYLCETRILLGPRAFQIPTPVGNYAPDWAIAFNKGTVKHIFFVAETKGSLDSMELRGIEKAKIACARKLFNNVSTSEIKYDTVASYDDLLNKIQGV